MFLLPEAKPVVVAGFRRHIVGDVRIVFGVRGGKRVGLGLLPWVRGLFQCRGIATLVAKTTAVHGRVGGRIVHTALEKTRRKGTRVVGEDPYRGEWKRLSRSLIIEKGLNTSEVEHKQQQKEEDIHVCSSHILGDILGIKRYGCQSCSWWAGKGK